MQLMPGACRDMNVTNAFDPDQNMKGGTEYLARQVANVRLALENDESTAPSSFVLRVALAAYNAGFGYCKVALKELRARQMPLTWENFKAVFPAASVRGLKPDWKQALGYAEKILPPTPEHPE